MSGARTTAFDQPYAQRIVVARQDSARLCLLELQRELELKTAVDVGCGVGYFSQFLSELGLEVLGIDGREDNVAEARRRVPEVRFVVGDLEDPGIVALGCYDLVFCFGVLYHLENPFRAIRNLAAMTNRVLLLESMFSPSSRPSMQLLDEPRGEDQSLTGVAFYPSEKCLVKMCYQSGFSYVYRISNLADHEDFRASLWRKRRRTMLVASRARLDVKGLCLAADPSGVYDPWVTWLGRARGAILRFGHFLGKPWGAKLRSLGYHWLRVFPNSVFLVRLPFGSWWLARNDACGMGILHGLFEPHESRVVGWFLKPGMTVLDVGAHHGFYTLLASRKVGPRGHVISFEPSPRERRYLVQHLQVNRCRNVSVEPCALGCSEGRADLFVVDRVETGCNSLRPPNASRPTTRLSVPIETLDGYLHRRGIARVDFIKLDVEGAEMEILRGAAGMLHRSPRPGILCEVEDIRTQPWGYRASEIIDHLREYSYSCFGFTPSGDLERVDENQREFDGNYMCIPEERVREFNEAWRKDEAELNRLRLMTD